MSPPLVSILVPAFNSAPWIETTLDSALAQTHPRCEIIVVNDGSTDHTLAIAEAHAARHPGKIRIVSQPNAGAAAARNHALHLAAGDFIQYLDADDLLAPDKISRQLARLAAAPPRSLASGRWGRFTDTPASTRFADDDLARDFAPADWLRLHLGEHRMMHPAAWLAPLPILQAAGPWNEKLSLNDDGEYFARVVEQSALIVNEPLAVSHYRSQLRGSLSRTRSQAGWRSLHHSLQLTADVLLRLDPSPAARTAAADALQRFIYEAWPDAAAPRRCALARVHQLGGSRLQPEIPRWAARVARLLGWRAGLLAHKTATLLRR